MGLVSSIEIFQQFMIAIFFTTLKNYNGEHNKDFKPRQRLQKTG